MFIAMNINNVAKDFLHILIYVDSFNILCTYLICLVKCCDARYDLSQIVQ